MSVVHDYVNAIVRRRREPMEPIGFEPDWADKPRRHKVYREATRFPLPGPAGAPSERTTLDAALRPGPAGGRFSLDTLSELLRDSYGLLGRRLGVQANSDEQLLPQYRSAVWWRGTASGGGMYPAEIYWVTGSRGPMLPGVYYYSAPHHAMQRLLAGDVVDQVRAALGPDGSVPTDQFLLVSLKFWTNAFKYNSFCYHVVTMDIGTLLGTWQMTSRSQGITLRPILNFDELALNRLLGLTSHAESVFAVVPLPWDVPDATPEPAAPEPVPVAEVNRPRVHLQEEERSRRVIRFPQVEEVHAEILAADRPRPTAADLAAAIPAPPVRPAAERLALPDPEPLRASVPEALRGRRSSFGRFSAHRPLTRAELSALLVAGTAGGRLVSDVKDESGGPGLTRLAVFTNHVEGVARGGYDYDPTRHELGVASPGDAALFLQRNYFLPNYNLEQVAAVLVVLARPEAVMEVAGPRGYRFVNAEVGAVAQAVYTASAALGVGCGAALGFDNVSYAERLGIEGTGEWPLLILMVGRERPGEPNIDHRLA
ncbi:SagB-type dehydrogenase family enzyme [Actinomadura pelletieri DSM 43383]|uniref:SagB-type dehydrogenase family enzyme n=1 Tax=Actinomadura pelletieri DSM 43383 TaxID=1120940 RepID=A0A495QGG0_9ACTN|nr:SagB family peptide dehydrogenase [Actinomadura pelletieri]RKS71000.1 SagB-type dehydrogenase family enzyme [Actinomadura pelletieri DSM 43383]